MFVFLYRVIIITCSLDKVLVCRVNPFFVLNYRSGHIPPNRLPIKRWPYRWLIDRRRPVVSKCSLKWVPILSKIARKKSRLWFWKYFVKFHFFWETSYPLKSEIPNEYHKKFWYKDEILGVSGELCLFYQIELYTKMDVSENMSPFVLEYVLHWLAYDGWFIIRLNSVMYAHENDIPLVVHSYPPFRGKLAAVKVFFSAVVLN